MKQYTAFIVCLMIVVLGVFPAEGKEYTVGLVPYIGFTPFVIADAKGFFAEEGAGVKLKYYLTQEEWINAFFYKRYDMVIVWNAAHIGWYINGNHFISIGAYAHEQGSYRLVASPEVTPQTIASQKIGGASNAFSYQWMLWNYLKPHNIPMSAVNIVTLASEDVLLKNFLVGRLQAIMVRENFAERAIQEVNGVVLSASTPEQIPPFNSDAS